MFYLLAFLQLSYFRSSAVCLLYFFSLSFPCTFNYSNEYKFACLLAVCLLVVISNFLLPLLGRGGGGGWVCFVGKIRGWPSAKESTTGDTWTESALPLSNPTNDSTLVGRPVV